MYIVIVALLGSCDDNFNNTIECNSVNVNIDFPNDINPGTITNGVISFRNLSSGVTVRFTYPLVDTPKLLTGLYDIDFTAEAITTSGMTVSVKGISRSVEILSDGMFLQLQTFCNIETDDLIISEVFFTGTLQNSGNEYTGDDYVKLYNNTGHVIYADGITLFETKFLTSQKLVITPDIMNDAVTVQALYTIPGNGKEHPVQPGEYILLADIGIDHRSANPNSFSLEHADWEWYDISLSPSHMDIDAPGVPNLDKWYCYTQSIWMLHNRGFKAFGIARIPIDKETYLRDYYYTYDYDLVTTAGTFSMSQSAYKIPNEWVIDAVNCAVESEWQWNVTAPSIDMGWAYCGTIDKDKTRYFHSVRRKLLYVTENGRAVFKDTNNSSVDFNSHVTPSEIELQNTITGLGLPNATIVTYDGITKVSE